jgi:sigma-B regulation protein RsbU (phosphoserine phosphatase)
MPDLPEIAVHGTSDPALEVGGDYFDFIHVDDDHLGIVVGDVSGKGIPGALVMATLRSALRAEARGELSPKAVLQRVNSLVTRDTKEGIFVSVTYGILDRRTGKFRYARAGHEPLICCHEREARLTTHEPPGMVLGMLEGEVFDLLEEQEEDISKCGTAVLYTDGVPEAMNADAEEYGVERFHEVLVKNAGKDPEEISARVLEDIRQFSEGIPQHDDITLVVLRWRGQGGESNPGPGPSPDAQG